VTFATEPDTVHRSDANAMADGKISVTAMDTDMTAGYLGQIRTAIQLKHLDP